MRKERELMNLARRIRARGETLELTQEQLATVERDTLASTISASQT